jgi:hypothetical protein
MPFQINDGRRGVVYGGLTVERDSTIFSTNSDDDTVVFPATVMFPPTETFPLIPVPPATMSPRPRVCADYAAENV